MSKRVKVIPHKKVIEVKGIIKRFNMDINTINNEIASISSNLLYTDSKLVSLNALELWDLVKITSKKRSRLEKSLADFERVKSNLVQNREFYIVKCRELRKIHKSLKFAEEHLKQAKLGKYDEIYGCERGLIEKATTHVKLITHRIDNFKI